MTILDKKRFFGNTFAMLGAPAIFGLTASFLAVGGRDGEPWHLLWTVPLSVVALPLLPFWLLGDKIIRDVNEEEFHIRTKDLEKISLPKDYLYIVQLDGKWMVEPLCLEDEEAPFDSEDDARLFMKCLHYKEVLSIDSGRLQTFWIKDA